MRVLQFIAGILLVFPFIAAVCVAPLLAAQHWWGRTGLWITSIAWWLWFTGVAAFESWRDLADLGSIMAFVGVFVAVAWTPACFIDWASRRTPKLSVLRRLGWGVLGYYAGATGVFLCAVVVGVVVGLYWRWVK